MKNFLLGLSVLAVTLTLGYVQKVQAATQGTLGATSNGSKLITITIPKRVQITNVADFSATWNSGDGNLEDNDDLCIYSNAGTGQYTVTADSADGSGTFTLDSGGTNLVYAVAWTAASAGNFAGGTALTDNTASGTFAGASTTSATCSGGDTATVSIQILSAALEAVTGTTTDFTDTLTLTVTPI
jgi:hypothetical protein